jgi:methylated-DNA-[protein]-cysteine S-methyltransferase
LIEDAEHPIILKTEKQLEQYFNQERTTFQLPLEFEGTDFQNKIWKTLQNIPFGQTISYKEIALKIGHPLAVRAVGAAIGRNPISIVIPCHRVIGSNGKMTGFAGGLKNKEILLKLEGN